MGGERRLESTSYPGIYKRINPEGKVEGYQIKPRFPGYAGPKSFTRDRLTDARALLDQIRSDLRQGRSGAEHRRTLGEGIARYRVEELPKLASTDAATANGPVKYATANRYKATLSAVLSSCVDWEWIQVNPLHSGSRRK